jgi:hypothetical protein
MDKVKKKAIVWALACLAPLQAAGETPAAGANRLKEKQHQVVGFLEDSDKLTRVQCTVLLPLLATLREAGQIPQVLDQPALPNLLENVKLACAEIRPLYRDALGKAREVEQGLR